MGSSYYGNHPNSSGGGGSSSSSSRKSKKSSSSSEKPKQPQRGLGVAQLEKIRLHGQMGCALPPNYPPTFPSQQVMQMQDDMGMRVQSAYSPQMPSSPSFTHPSSSPSSYGFHPNIMMGAGRYGDSQQSTVPSWNQENSYFETQHFGQPTRSLFQVEGSQQNGGSNHHHRSRSMGSASPNSRSSDNEEVDLELRLSI